MKRTLIYLMSFLLGILNVQAQPVFNITNYGAVGDSTTLNTRAIQKTVDKASEAGGKVYVPEGVFLSGTIILKSNVTLQLSPKAKLLGSPDINDYKTMTWGHHKDRTPWHLVMAKDAENITICGQGTIDGNGPEYWKEREHEWAFYPEKDYRPTPMVEIENCENVIIRDVTMKHAAGWCLHPYNSRNVKINNITILNSPFGPNSDGIDITGCRSVTVSDSYIDCGDDAIALKTTEDSRPCEYITVTNCVLSTNCVAFRVGFESRKDFRYITFSNSVVKKCSRIIDLRSIEGGTIEHVNISGITGNTNSGWVLNRVIEMDLTKENTPHDVTQKEHPNYGVKKPVKEVGAIRDISITDLDIYTDGRIMMASVPEGEMSNIYLSNIHLHYAMLDDPLPFAAEAGGTSFFKDHKDVRSARAAFVAKNVSRLNINDIRLTWPTYPVPDSWKLLKSPHRFLNEAYYKGNEKKLRSGAMKPTFHVLWAKGLKNSSIDVSMAEPSDPAVSKTVIKNSDIKLKK
jgi:pectate lyase